MDSKGFTTIDFVFTLFLTLIIIILTLNLFGTSIDNKNIIEEDINSRLLMDKLANSINQVSSNKVGNANEIFIFNISPNYYYFSITKDKIVIKYQDKTGESNIIPIRLINYNKELINEFRMNKGERYIIRKILDNDNLTAIQIYNIP